ncbi:MAG: TlpA family protein disulfide reductase [Candidatus Omnitrophica bacterium]|nr:TlpA family protein disulfide reductase [Candidatus Omnitrophota bacterium]
MKKIICAFIFLLILSAFLNAQSLYKEVMNFALDSLEGKKVELSDFKNKPLLLFFWTIRCPHCRRALFLLNQIYPELEDSNIEILGINIEESADKIKRFLKDYPLTFKILLDSDGKVARIYRVIGVPTYILIDKEGKVKFQGSYFPFDYKNLLGD